MDENPLESAVLPPHQFFETAKAVVIEITKDLRMQLVACGKMPDERTCQAIAAHMMRAVVKHTVATLNCESAGADMCDVRDLHESDLAAWLLDTDSGEIEKVSFGSN